MLVHMWSKDNALRKTNTPDIASFHIIPETLFPENRAGKAHLAASKVCWDYPIDERYASTNLRVLEEGRRRRFARLARHRSATVCLVCSELFRSRYIYRTDSNRRLWYNPVTDDM